MVVLLLSEMGNYVMQRRVRRSHRALIFQLDCTALSSDLEKSFLFPNKVDHIIETIFNIYYYYQKSDTIQIPYMSRLIISTSSMMLYICTALYIIHNIYRKGKKRQITTYLYGLFLFYFLVKKVNMFLLVYRLG